MTRAWHNAWTPPSLPNSTVLLGGWTSEARLTAEIVPGIAKQRYQLLIIFPGGATFSLEHSGDLTCGIPDGETIVLIGGLLHNYVTR